MDKAISVYEETTTCGWGEVCVLVHKTEREEVKNEFVTEQSQYWGAELLSLESKGCHQSHDTHTGLLLHPELPS